MINEMPPSLIAHRLEPGAQERQDSLLRHLAYRRGILAENAVAWWYRIRWYRVVAHRYRTARGEVDLVLLRNRTVVFVEVKSRHSVEDARDAVHEEAVGRISAAAEIFLSRHPHLAGYETRFDLIAVLPDFRFSRFKEVF